MVVSADRAGGFGGEFASTRAPTGSRLERGIHMDGDRLHLERISMSPPSLLHLRACLPRGSGSLRLARDGNAGERTEHFEFRHRWHNSGGARVVPSGTRLAQVCVTKWLAARS